MAGYIIELFWKVHIDNFDDFITYIIKTYKIFDNDDGVDYSVERYKYFYDFRQYYKTSIKSSTYLYLCVDSYDGIVYSLSYAEYHRESKIWLDKNNCRYMGEFHSRREKLERLKILS